MPFIIRQRAAGKIINPLRSLSLKKNCNEKKQLAHFYTFTFFIP